MELAKLLRQRGGRITHARQAVWDALIEIDGHATVQDIVEMIGGYQRTDRVGDASFGDHLDKAKREAPSVNPSSVYRSLQLFDELGLVRESRTGGSSQSTWEIRHPDAHIHLVCTTCGEVTHHPSAAVEALGVEIAAAGFLTSAIDVRVDGHCASCGQATSAERVHGL